MFYVYGNEIRVLYNRLQAFRIGYRCVLIKVNQQKQFFITPDFPKEKSGVINYPGCCNQFLVSNLC
jgi:hypothetical protein